MNVMDAIYKRRSIRKYTDAPISDESIKEILKAGMYAPSGGNEQAWDFIVVRDKVKLEKIVEFHPYAKCLLGCNAAVIVCGNKEKERFEGLWIQDCSASTQNMLLAATAQDIGSVWLGLYPEMSRVEGVKELFNLPDHIIPFSIVSLGYADESRDVPERFNPDSIHMENW